MWSVINVANNKFKKFYITGPDYRYIVSTSEKMFVWGILCHFDLPTAFNQ